MSDLVERLRQMTGRHDIEAADEIERLRREVVSRNRRALDLTADNAALRELLREWRRVYGIRSNIYYATDAALKGEKYE